MESYRAWRAEVDAAWEGLERRMEQLPSSLAALGWRFLERQGRANQPPRDYFSSPSAAPLMYLPLWMREALRRARRWPENPAANEAVRHILMAAMWGYLFIRIQDDLLDEEGPATDTRADALFGNVCVHEMMRWFAEATRGVPEFAGAFEHVWLEFSALTLEERAQLLSDQPYPAERFEAHAAKVAFACAPMLAVCAVGGCLEEYRWPISTLVHRLGVAYGLENDVRGWERDLANGHRTYLLACAGWTHASPRLTREELEERLHTGGLLFGFLGQARNWYERALGAARVLGLEPEFEPYVRERRGWIEGSQMKLLSLDIALALRRLPAAMHSPPAPAPGDKTQR